MTSAAVCAVVVAFACFAPRVVGAGEEEPSFVGPIFGADILPNAPGAWNVSWLLGYSHAAGVGDVEPAVQVLAGLGTGLGAEVNIPFVAEEAAGSIAVGDVDARLKYAAVTPGARRAGLILGIGWTVPSSRESASAALSTSLGLARAWPRCSAQCHVEYTRAMRAPGGATGAGAYRLSAQVGTPLRTGVLNAVGDVVYGSSGRKREIYFAPGVSCTPNGSTTVAISVQLGRVSGQATWGFLSQVQFSL